MYSVQFSYNLYNSVCGEGADLDRWEREFKNCKQGTTVTFLNLPRGIT